MDATASFNDKTVLVTGANGFIGNCTARAFARAGWKTYGLVRSEASIAYLERSEIVPILGSASDLIFLDTDPALREVAFDIIVSTTENLSDYLPHFTDTVSLLQAVSRRAKQRTGKKPLVLFSSGCKDYGTTALHGSAELHAHTETSPLQPAFFIKPRTENAMQLLEHEELFHTAVLRPTTVYGLSGSYYALFFERAEAARSEHGGVIRIAQRKKSIVHGTHGDDVGEAYLALATHAVMHGTTDIHGQCFNISGRKYEVLEDIVAALVREYGLAGVEWLGEDVEVIDWTQPREIDADAVLLGFSQWVGSQKIRDLTGWCDRRMSFQDGLRVYRKSFEAFRDSKSRI
ncbi:hypothetical protein BP5796_01581 [Coleophoma crateriformis]|uniref:NAD-dependent epimerase/dehydratase domain-containing protein n=1 Tax=Coleophoma crateriformis TaxID=565419 RepID=A0A3D8T0T7_9HELO|nr:hypothetical protein BP5796_01581 [Coleophoma crateriformis]